VAWLNFADRPETHDAAIDGARKVASRTDDAVQMLETRTGAGNLRPHRRDSVRSTSTRRRGCARALAHVRDNLDHVYRPPADDPLPYRNCPSGSARRTADGAAMARRAMAATPSELDEAEQIVRAYQEFAGAAGRCSQSRRVASR